MSIKLFQQCGRCVNIWRSNDLPTRHRHDASRGSFIIHGSKDVFPHRSQFGLEGDLMGEPMSNMIIIDGYQIQLQGIKPTYIGQQVIFLH
jgi:hypothetical protein